MGKAKGRRLKRYLGLRRARGVSFYGGIDRLLPGRLIGWVMATDPNVPFYEVRLLVGPHLIARAEINQPRPDVCDQLSREGNPGFVMGLPVDLPPLDWTLPVRVVAVSADGNSQVELSLMQKKSNTHESLSSLLQSDQRGMDGHVDGIQNGELLGWAGCRGQKKPATIWLQAEGVEPILLNCSEWRDGMGHQQLNPQCGFSLPLDELPPLWADKTIWCSFDKAGHWCVPQDQTLVVPSLERRASSDIEHYSSANLTEVVTSSYSSQLASAPVDLQAHWRA